MLPVFLFGFFLALVSSYFESSPFLRDWSKKIFVCSSPVGSVLVKCVWICCFLGVFDGSFSYVLIWCWVFCPEVRSSYLRFFSGLPS